MSAERSAFSGEPSEQSERPERMRGRRVRCNAMFGGDARCSHTIWNTDLSDRRRSPYPAATASRCAASFCGADKFGAWLVSIENTF
jgi:hypothetical protein